MSTSGAIAASALGREGVLCRRPGRVVARRGGAVVRIARADVRAGGPAARRIVDDVVASAEAQRLLDAAVPGVFAGVLEVRAGVDALSGAPTAAVVLEGFDCSVADLLAVGARPDPETLGAIARRTLEVLQRLHSAGGRGHGNLKPGNVLLRFGKGGVEVRLTDPAPAGAPDAAAADLRAVSEMLGVLAGGAGAAGAVQRGAWRRFGGSASAWRGLLERMSEGAVSAGEAAAGVPSYLWRRIVRTVGVVAVSLAVVAGVGFGAGAGVRAWQRARDSARLEAGRADWARFMDENAAWFGAFAEAMSRPDVAADPRLGELLAGWSPAEPYTEGALRRLLKAEGFTDVPVPLERESHTVYLTTPEPGLRIAAWLAEGVEQIETLRTRLAGPETGAEWGARARVRRVEEEFRRRGWKVAADAAAQLLEDTLPPEIRESETRRKTVIGEAVRAVAGLSDEAASVLADLERLDSAVQALQEREEPARAWLLAHADQGVRERTTGSPSDILRDAAAALRSSGDLADRVRAAVTRRWGAIDPAAMRAEDGVYAEASERTLPERRLEAWLAALDNPAYERLVEPHPDDALLPRVAGVDRLLAEAERRAGPLPGLREALRRIEAEIRTRRGEPWVRGRMAEVVAASADAAARLETLHAEVSGRLMTPGEVLAEILDGLGTSWPERTPARDAFAERVAALAREMEESGDGWAFRQRVEAVREEFRTLEGRFPAFALPGSAAALIDGAVVGRAMRAARDEALRAAVAADASAESRWRERLERVGAAVGAAVGLAGAAEAWSVGPDEAGAFERLLGSAGFAEAGGEAAFAAFLARLRPLVAAARSDRGRLAELLLRSNDEAVIFTAWSALGAIEGGDAWPATAEELASDAAAVRVLLDRLEAGAVRDAARAEALRRLLESESRSRWLKACARVGGGRRLGEVLSVGLDRGLDRDATLPPEVRYNLAVQAAVRERLGGADAAAAGAAGRRLEEVLAGVDGAPRVVADRLREVARLGGADSGPRGDPREFGPGALPGWEAERDEGNRWVRFRRRHGASPIDLTFVPVAVPEGDGLVTHYVCTTELSVGDARAILARPDAAERLARAWRGLNLSGPVAPWRGVRTWIAGGGTLQANQGWLHRPAALPPEFDPTAGEATPRTPELESPLQAVPYWAAGRLAAEIGCEIPSAEVWLALYEAEELGGGLAERPNLRDASWDRQRRHTLRLRASEGLPPGVVETAGASIFIDGGEGDLPDDAPLSGLDDGWTFFAPVTDDRESPAVRHLVGNVAEFVRVGDDESLGGVVGGSALGTADAAAAATVVPLKNRLTANVPFADVGLRPAFRAEGVRFSRPASEVIAQFLDAPPYLEGETLRTAVARALAEGGGG